jgi:hypothetical protein
MTESLKPFTRDDVKAVMKEHGLCEEGFAYIRRSGEKIGIVGDYRDRDSFFDEVAFCIKRLSAMRRVKTMTRAGSGSYAIKHVVERSWILDEEGLSHGYVCNGALIVAAYLLGIGVKRYGYPGPNAAIGVFEADVRALAAATEKRVNLATARVRHPLQAASWYKGAVAKSSS